MEEKFEQIIQSDLHRYLMSMGETEDRLPDVPDIEGLWENIARAYIPDGIREFTNYPTVSLGWMMYVGMAVAKHWDADWESYPKEHPYENLREVRGYDCMDEFVREEVLNLNDVEYKQTEDLVAECASRTYGNLRRQCIEPGTPEAFRAYVACLHQLYLMGSTVELYRLGYRMQKL